MKKFNLFILFFGLFQVANAQCTNPVNFSEVWSIPYTPANTKIPMTTAYDNNGQNYLYVAARSQGLMIYDMANINVPVFSNSISIASLDSQYVMNLTQSGNYLFLAMGDHWDTTGTRASLAIINVANPAIPVIEDIWHSTDTVNGSAIVKVQGNYAFLGGMQQGLFILDVSVKNNIQFVSQFIPPINWPDASGGPAKFNARGMEVKNNILYLCYDNGGIRVIDITNKSVPVETGRYANAALIGKPRAYNNIYLNDSLLYVAHDFCGMEILNVKDTSNIQLLSWWNPRQCDVYYGLFDWWGSTLHMNEIVYDSACKTVFMSGGQTEIMAMNVADPYNPDSCEMFGTHTNNLGTWGISKYQDKLFAAYIWAVIPFSSNFSGIKMIQYDACAVGIEEELVDGGFRIYPNPANSAVTIELKSLALNDYKYEIRDITGKLIISNSIFSGAKILNFSVEGIAKGVYMISIKNNNGLIGTTNLITY